MITKQIHCTVCGQPAQAQTGTKAWYHIDCTQCGPYLLSGTLQEAGVGASGAAKDDLYLLSAWIRQRQRDGQPPPELASHNVPVIIANAPRYTPEEKMEQLLVLLGGLLKNAGRDLNGNQLSPADAWAHDGAELNVLMAWLAKDGLTERPGDSATVRLTRKGWQSFDSLSRRKQHTGKRCFVAMWFADEMDAAYETGLRAAIIEAGFDAFRIKEDVHDERIDARIIAHIRDSRFVVADVTGGRSAVYYEAGFAEGLGKPVIWTCRAKNKGDMSFDTRQYLHILWDDPADLRNQLVPVIKARII
jgi:hypothetical protein